MREFSDLLCELLATIAIISLAIIVWTGYLLWMILQMAVVVLAGIVFALCVLSLLFTCGGKIL
jgi:hypothetical protein